MEQTKLEFNGAWLRLAQRRWRAEGTVEQRHLGLAAFSPGADQRHETGMPLLKDREAQGEIFFLGREGFRREDGIGSAGSAVFLDPWSPLSPIL